MKSSTIEMKRRLISSLPLTRALIFKPEDSLRKVIEGMQNYAQGAALIVDRDHLAGIFTERDFLHLCHSQEKPMDTPISQWMTKKTMSLHYNDTLLDALTLMVERGIRHIPILESEQFASKILSARDLIDFFAEQSPSETFDGPLPSLDSFPSDFLEDE